jgi:hypothetical protein
MTKWDAPERGSRTHVDVKTMLNEYCGMMIVDVSTQGNYVDNAA